MNNFFNRFFHPKIKPLTLKFLLQVFAIYFLFFGIYRLIFLIQYIPINESGLGKELWKSLLLGLRFDLRLVSIITLLSTIPYILLKKLKKSWFYILVFHMGLITLLTIICITDFYYYAYLNSRLNASAIQFLKNPLISGQMVFQTYPVFKITLGLVLFMAVLFIIFKRSIQAHIQNINNSSDQTHSKKQLFISLVPHYIVFFVFMALGIYGSFQAYPLRWSEAFHSSNQFFSQLSLNPILYFFDTYSFRNAEYNEKEVSKYYPILAEKLGIKNYDDKKLNFLREYSDLPKLNIPNEQNIIVVIMESMSSHKTGLGGSIVNPTPFLDKLKDESIYFKNFYTTTVATARSVFTSITSLADVSRVKTGSRNPFIVNQHTNISELTNHKKYYFLGGSANWGNIRGILTNNIPDLNIYEEGSFQSPKVDVWGISDFDLFREAFEVIKLDLKEKQKPIFAIVQTAGFHRPYTIPQSIPGFKALSDKDVNVNQLKEYGFESLEELNSMRLQDFSLGSFVQRIKNSPEFANTILIIYGDHGLPHNGAPNVPEWKKNVHNGYHVPLLIYAQNKDLKDFSPRTEDKISSLVDIMPTVAHIAGVPHRTRSFGKSLMINDPIVDQNRFAFSYNWYAPFHLSLITKDYYLELIPQSDGRIDNGTLKKWSGINANEELKEKEPQTYNEMALFSNALYEASKYLLHHNPKIQ